jgi:hypothetical protein
MPADRSDAPPGFLDMLKAHVEETGRGLTERFPVRVARFPAWRTGRLGATRVVFPRPTPAFSCSPDAYCASELQEEANCAIMEGR